jgi:hypothetical protein
MAVDSTSILLYCFTPTLPAWAQGPYSSLTAFRSVSRQAMSITRDQRRSIERRLVRSAALGYGFLAP